MGGPWSKGRAPGVGVRVGTDRGWLGWGSVVKGPPGVEDRGSGRGYGGSVQVGPRVWGVRPGRAAGMGGPSRSGRGYGGSVQVGPRVWGVRPGRAAGMGGPSRSVQGSSTVGVRGRRPAPWGRGPDGRGCRSPWSKGWAPGVGVRVGPRVWGSVVQGLANWSEAAWSRGPDGGGCGGVRGQRAGRLE